MVTYIAKEEVEKVLKYEDLIPLIERCLANLSDRENGGIVQPLRSCLKIPHTTGSLYTMPCVVQKDEAMAVKLVTRYPESYPTHHAVIALFNSGNGSLQSIMDGECITAMRTAAASAVALKHLFKGKHERKEILCFIGSGQQAYSHFEAFKHIHSFTETRVWSRTYENAEQFAKTTGAVAYHTVKEAVSQADVIVTVTSAENPVLFGDWVKPGALVCAVGAPSKNLRELDDKLMHNSLIFVESHESAMAESGDIILSQAKITGELGEVIAGKVTVDTASDKIILFKSLGIAVYDTVSAKLVHEKHKSSKC